MTSQTITSDNVAFAQHQQTAKIRYTSQYFADPKSHHQRGCNENQIGLIRQYLTLETELNDYSNKEILASRAKINAKTRKKLNYFSPNKLFLQLVAFQT